MKKDIYVINLARSPHRKKHILNELGNLDLSCKVVEAIDGKDSEIEDFPLYDHKYTMRKLGKAMLPTEIACFMSHVKAIRQAYEDGMDYVVILEDDAFLHGSFKKVYETAMGADKFDAIRFIEYNTKKNATNDNITVLEKTDYKEWGGGHGYGITRIGMEKVLANVDKIFIKFDQFLWFIMAHRGLSMGATNYNVVYVSRDEFNSDIGYKERQERNLFYRSIWRVKEFFNIW